LNVQQILEDADLLAPNAFSIEQKVKWMNQVQMQAYRELDTIFSSRPPDIKVDNLTFIPWLPVEYHELYSLGIGKRIAERTQDFNLADQLDLRYQQLLIRAKIETAPKLKKVKINRAWL
jgi:hypothetical protein